MLLVRGVLIFAEMPRDGRETVALGNHMTSSTSNPRNHEYTYTTKPYFGACARVDSKHNGFVVYFCDITIPEAFVVPVEPFDVIIASLVFDVVAITDKMYISSLTNVLQYLKVKSPN